MKKRFKPAIIGLIGGIGLTMGVLHHSSPEAQKAREMDRKVGYILPQSGNTHKYTLSNGKVATLSIIEGRFCWVGGFQHRMAITIDSKYRLISEWFDHRRTYRGDARILDQLRINEQNSEMTIIRRGEIEDYPAWQHTYETMINDLYTKKKANDETKEKEKFKKLAEAKKTLQNLKEELP